MIINCTLSVSSLANAAKQLRQYADSLKDKSDKLCRKVGEYGVERAKLYWDQGHHDDTGETRSSIMYVDNGTDRYVMAGGAAVWVEFGTGIIRNGGTAGIYVHPKAQELGMSAIGTYGKGNGANPHGWHFPSRYIGWDAITKGISANPFIYTASQDMRRELLDMAKEVFKTS